MEERLPGGRDGVSGIDEVGGDLVLRDCRERGVDGGEVAGRDGVAAHGAGDGVVVQILCRGVLEDVLAPDAATVGGFVVLYTHCNVRSSCVVRGRPRVSTYDRVHPSHGRRGAVVRDEVAQAGVIAVAVAEDD